MERRHSAQRFRNNLHGLLFLITLFIASLMVANIIPPLKRHSAIASNSSPIKNIWFIQMENTNWTGYLALKGNPLAPYINNTLLPMAAHAEQYFTPPNNHPSLTNYLWEEAGDNLGVADDAPPSTHHFSTTDHFVTYLTNAGYTWKTYAEDISGTNCPLSAVNEYVPRHNGVIYFDDVTSSNSATSAYCIAHVRPYAELSADLQNNSIPNFTYIVPNLCHDMHGNGSTCGTTNIITQADNWLQNLIPQITATSAYQNSGAIMLWWDEGQDSACHIDSDGPLPFMILSPFETSQGYSNAIYYTHSSTVKTLEEIFGLTPLLRHAGDSAVNDLGDLFQPGVVTPSPQPSPVGSPPPTPTPTPLPGTTIAQDTFQRPDQPFWGTASDGNVWGGNANKNTAFSINTNTGQIHASSAVKMDAILGPCVANAEVLLSGSMTSLRAGVNTFGPVLRWTGVANFYRALLSGSNLVIQKDVKGTLTNLKSVSFPALRSTSYLIRFNVTGTTLSAKAWQSGTQEPGSWMVTVTDSTFSEGYAGMRTYQQSGVITSITSFQAIQQ